MIFQHLTWDLVQWLLQYITRKSLANFVIVTISVTKSIQVKRDHLQPGLDLGGGSAGPDLKDGQDLDNFQCFPHGSRRFFSTQLM